MSSSFPFVSLLMRYLNLPSSNVVLKAYNHAHPSQWHSDRTCSKTSSPPSPQIEVELDLRSVTPTKSSSALDVYCPQSRRRLSQPQNSVEHLDVISTWKGLYIAQVYEIVFWENSFKASLEKLVSEALMVRFWEQRRHLG